MRGVGRVATGPFSVFDEKTLGSKNGHFDYIRLVFWWILDLKPDFLDKTQAKNIPITRYTQKPFEGNNLKSIFPLKRTFAEYVCTLSPFSAKTHVFLRPKANTQKLMSIAMGRFKGRFFTKFWKSPVNVALSANTRAKDIKNQNRVTIRFDR